MEKSSFLFYNGTMIKSSIFKSYDIRGIYPDQLNEATAFEIGRGFVRHTNTKKVAVGHDARLSSPELFRALCEGIISQGANVYSIGQVPTELVYFAIGSYDFDGAIMITASHNPKEYNGFKMMKKEGNDIVWIRGKDMFSVIQENRHIDVPKGTIHEQDIWDDFIKRMLGFVKTQIKPFKVAVDASNGVIGKAIEMLKPHVPVEVLEVNFEPDGNFPNHAPNPLEEGSINQIRGKIIKEKADFGFMFDGDADRIFLVDETGVMIPADIVLLFLAKYFLQQDKGLAVAYNVFCSRAVPEFIKKWEGVPVRTQVGFVNVREGLIKNNGVLGGETSAHYSFRDNFYTDSGIIAFLILLQIVSSENKKVSELAKELEIYYKTSEINFEINNKEEAIERIKEKYSDGKQDFLDGVTVEYKDWWFTVRISNTEPLLRLIIEATTKDLLEQKKKELSEFIQQ